MLKLKKIRILREIKQELHAVYFHLIGKILVLTLSKKMEQKKYKISLCLIFKDEAPFLKEWIDYHKLIGVDHFYLYNNHSTDHYRLVIQSYIDDGIVTLIEWPYQEAQMAAYRNCYENYRGDSNWISFIDADEFICLKYKEDITDWLSGYSNSPSVVVPWRVFGTGGVLQHDYNRLVIEQYQVCWDRFYQYGKCFVNTKYDIANFDTWYMHHLTYMTIRIGKWIIKIPPVDQFRRFCILGRLKNSTPKEVNNSTVQINHYFTKAWDIYSAKRSKTDVYFKNNPKENLALFEKFELKCISCDYTIHRFLIRLKMHRGEIK